MIKCFFGFHDLVFYETKVPCNNSEEKVTYKKCKRCGKIKEGMLYVDRGVPLTATSIKAIIDYEESKDWFNKLT